jgi:DNA repair photolyase
MDSLPQMSFDNNSGDGPPQKERPDRIGRTTIAYRDASSILTRATGFMSDYDFTLNPYSGCGFGCTYCYAAFFSRDEDRRATWGNWVEVKQNALSVLRRMRTPLAGKAIYMSSVTDPYQPIEKRLELVRELLKTLVDRQPRLVVQTRSPLVTRDIDLLRRFDHVRVNMTVTTDSERVRKAFEPMCPANRVRLQAIAEVAAAGIDAGVTLTPLLPVEDPYAFSRALRDTGVRRFVVQPFHAERGRFVAGTREQALKLVTDLGWTTDRYRETVDVLGSQLPDLAEGRDGFAPS